jgi:hypothetical protein
VSTSDWAARTAAVGTVVAVAAAVGIGLVQLRAQRRLSAIERTIAHREVFTTGEIGDARGRLSRRMARAGKTEGGEEKYRQPHWEELVGHQYMTVPSGMTDLSIYPPDMQPEAGQSPLRDLYSILWAVQRIAEAYRGGLLDRDLARSMLADHIVRWDVMCEHITPEHTSYVVSLKQLAASLSDKRRAEWARSSFLPRRPDSPVIADPTAT